MNPTEAYRAEIKPWSLVFLALALVAESAHALIFGSPLFWSLLRDAKGLDGLIVQLTFPFAAVAIFVTYLEERSWPKFARKRRPVPTPLPPRPSRNPSRMCRASGSAMLASWGWSRLISAGVCPP